MPLPKKEPMNWFKLQSIFGEYLIPIYELDDKPELKKAYLQNNESEMRRILTEEY
tara:strand:+ start:589 stop:753 length:165 start_codon:yes stop_codon:yes gene_type:complete